MKKVLTRLLFSSLVAAGLFAQQTPQQSGLPSSGPYQISGIVVDAVSGQPLAHARVAISAVNKDGSTTTTTGEDGRFVFSNLASGKYSLGAEHRGYTTQFFNQHENFSSSIAVGPELSSTDLLFRLPPECSISGRISDEAGEPVRNAQVILYQTGTAGGRQGTRLRLRGAADDEGVYIFRHLRAGKYFVAVSAKPWYAQHPARNPPLSSTAAGATDGPMPDATAGSYSQEQDSASLNVAYPVTFFPGVTQPDAATPISIKNGEKFVADVNLQPVPALRLHVPAENSGETARTPSVQLHDRLFGTRLGVPVDNQYLGTAGMDIVGIAPGHYEMQVSNANEGKNVTSYSEMDVASSGEINVEQKGSSISVSATIQLDADMVPPVRGYLQLISRTPEDSLAEQFSEGGEIEFKRSIRPGVYQLSLNGAGEFIKRVSATGATVTGRTLEVKGSGPVMLSVVIARGQGQITGTALRGGKPLAGVMILLVPADPANNQLLFRRDQSDSDGTFTLTAVVPGKYTLLALENGWDMEWMNPQVLQPYLGGGEVIQVQQNGRYDLKVKVQ